MSQSSMHVHCPTHVRLSYTVRAEAPQWEPTVSTGGGHSPQDCLSSQKDQQGTEWEHTASGPQCQAAGILR